MRITKLIVAVLLLSVFTQVEAKQKPKRIHRIVINGIQGPRDRTKIKPKHVAIAVLTVMVGSRVGEEFKH